ncbi:Lrp/AsnC family transcriptional regulator [Rhabdaerophilum sp. SD176]|uniref:Lrp/AsnC family transcriptional regulator n=1 Tax=Rhabdaerophilum sp. SD176 TaxID=2983548 RepID=UPI0024DF6F7F|nr:Lrp/AsnC family transcriptional regulator [Rhabdaerophilum sp. SD176]
MPNRVLDDVDSRLVALLRNDARQTAIELARRLGVSRATVQNRIERLVRDRVILGFTLRLDPGSERQVVRALTSIEIRSGDIRQVVAALRGIPEALAIYSTNGRWDVVVELVTEDLAQLDTVLGRIRDIVGVSHSETSILLTRL